MKGTKEINPQQGMRMNPYKGLNSYQEAEKDHFFGRDEEIDHLMLRIKQDRLTVLMGKSGIGKTSLLNAGLFPRLKDYGYFPIWIRLNYGPKTASLLDQVKNTIRAELKKGNIEIRPQVGDKQAKPLSTDETLWEYFRRVNHYKLSEHEGKKIETPVIPVLVFDQFEEIFTLGDQESEKEKNDLIHELYWLAEDQIPATFKEQFQESGDDTSGIKEPLSPHARLNTRLIISLREDYLAQLIALKPHIPSIKQSLFQVTHLNGKRAREIIHMPDGIQDNKIADQILRMFAPGDGKKGKAISDEILVVEPTILSVICFQVFAEGSKSFTPGDRDRILTNFYDSVIKEFPEKVERFIENKLINKEGRRVLFPLTTVMSLKKSLLQLVELRILRKAPMGTKDYIEIVHDVLTPIIKEKRDKRYRDRIQKRKVKRYFYRIVYGSILLGIAISSIFALYTRVQYKRAEINRLTAEALLEFPVDNTRAMRIAEAAYQKGLPQPPPRTIQTLGDIAFSSLEKPFYSASFQHKGPIYVALFSPGGDKILTTSEEGTGRVWDQKGNLQAELRGHTGRIMSAAFSPTGTYIVTGSWDRSARLWSIDGSFLKEFKTNGIVTVVGFSNNGKKVLAASRDGSVKLWDFQGNLLVGGIKHDGAIISAVFSPDDKKVLTASWDKTAKLWDDEGRVLSTFSHEDALSSALFSPDGRFSLTASWDKKARIWNLDGRLIQEFKHDEAVTSAVFSKDGQKILTASRDGICRIWSLDEKLPFLIRYGSPLKSAIFSTDDQKISAISEDGQVGIWDSEGRPLANLGDKEEQIRCAAFSPDGSQLLTGLDNGIARLWKWEFKERILVNLQEPPGDIKIVRFTPDGKSILTAASNNSIQLRVMDGTTPVPMEQHRVPISEVSFSRDGRFILTVAGDDGTVKLYDEKGTWLLDLKRPDSRIISAMISPDGKQILEVSGGTVGIWYIEGKSTKLKRRLTAWTEVSSAIFSPSGNQVLAGLADNSATLWDTDGHLLANLPIHQAPITSMSFSPNGQRILTASTDGTARLWSLKGKLIADLKHTGAVSVALFSPDSDHILTAGHQDNIATVWDDRGRRIMDLPHEKPVLCAAFSPDSRLIVTGSEDGKVLLWDNKGNLLFSVKHDGAISSLAFSADATHVLGLSKSGKAKLWLTPDALYRWLKRSVIAGLPKEEREKLDLD